MTVWYAEMRARDDVRGYQSASRQAVAGWRDGAIAAVLAAGARIIEADDDYVCLSHRDGYVTVCLWKQAI